ncbi:hypothetical protein V7S43_017434 [Phytophthora oleae]|uniref:Protein kinase domain-containing protein n=1 Tax=Phytophthora oleae TaxID=2107226 RepID=A0ABD3ETY2_9STRA
MLDQRWHSWSNLIDSKVDTSSRWHSQNVNLVQIRDRIGDFLIAQLKTSCLNSKNEDILAEWARDLREKLAEYEQESRQLLKLANTGRVIRELEHGIETTLSLLGSTDSSTAEEWISVLHREREERVKMYWCLLQDKQQLQTEVGDSEQQLAVLTLMKHDVDTFGAVLTPMELDLIDEFYDTLVCNSNIVVNSIPPWFETDKRRWSRSDESFVDQGEEACLRHVDTWGKLHHPHVRKFYGACHVGRPFIIHELTVARYTVENPWFHLYGCALGLKYVHERGLAHTKLTLDNLQSLYEFKGVLSGLGLDRIGCEASAEADVLAFALVMYEFLVNYLSRNDMELEQLKRDRRLPEDRPSFFNEKQWTLLLEMCVDDPTKRLSMIDVTHRLETIHTESNQDIWSDEEYFNSSPQLIDDIDEYSIPNAGLSISDVLQDADELCDELEDSLDINRPVYNRLVDVYQQFVSTEAPLPLTLVEDFGLILWRFYLRLEARSQDDWSAVATLCAANTIANRNYSLHYDIDRLIQSSDHLQTNAPVHHWQPNWKQTLQWRQETLGKCVDNAEEFLSSEEDANRRAEAATLLQYEAKTANGPRWLIPPHQIELGQHLADGSFGAVYLGKWFNTDVVVKQVLTNQSDRANREQFFHEVNLWASLNHDNLIKLYGACHLGQPFFVCERANEGTLISYIQDRRHFPAWRAIWEAARGLEYLHERGIVHGDLKGNNILVCDGTAKLADFGLSVFAESSTSEEAEGALGAFRWKAPECLAGSGPTFASDIYSFAMCISEAIGGDFPWGKTMPDSAVAFNVTNKRMIPPRPNGFTDAQWDLVVGMCSFEPQDRPNATALVHLLWKFA